MKYQYQRLRSFFRSLHRDAALDSLRNVLAFIGAATVLADFATMRYWMLIPALAVCFGIWRLDYWRHFRGDSAEESCARQLSEVKP